MNVSDHITNIFNYYKDNPGCDPNVFEYIEVCGDLTKYLNSGKSLELNRMIIDKFNLYSKEFFDKLTSCEIGVTKDSPLYRLCQDSKDCAVQGISLPDQELLQRIGGVSFYIMQQQRDVDKNIQESFIYDNEYEMNDLIKLNEILPNPRESKIVNNMNDATLTNLSPREELMIFISSQFKQKYNSSKNKKISKI